MTGKPPMRIKICGMRTIDDVAVCCEAGADALGFIFAQSPRRVSPEDRRVLRAMEAVPASVAIVGVFANDARELVDRALRSCRIDLLQFSGDETPEFCGSFGKPTLLSARDRRIDPPYLAAAHAVAVLVDSWSAVEFGGTGRTVRPADFAALRARCPGIPAVLAGGLTPRNVGELVEHIAPDAVDVRSGVERDGRKDAQLVRSFVAAARAAAGW